MKRLGDATRPRYVLALAMAVGLVGFVATPAEASTTDPYVAGDAYGVGSTMAIGGGASVLDPTPDAFFDTRVSRTTAGAADADIAIPVNPVVLAHIAHVHSDGTISGPHVRSTADLVDVTILSTLHLTAVHAECALDGSTSTSSWSVLDTNGKQVKPHTESIPGVATITFGETRQSIYSTTAGSFSVRTVNAIHITLLKAVHAVDIIIGHASCDPFNPYGVAVGPDGPVRPDPLVTVLSKCLVHLCTT